MSIVSSTVLVGGSLAIPVGAIQPADTVHRAGLDLTYPTIDAIVAANTIPFEEAPLDILAALTVAGRILISRASSEGLSWRVIGFRLGRGGYNPSLPLEPLSLDETDTELLDPFYPVLSADPADIARYEQPNSSAMSFLCRAAAGDCVAGIGEIGLYAEILASPTDSTEVGDRYLWAHCHRPLMGVTNQDTLVWRLVVQLSLGSS